MIENLLFTGLDVDENFFNVSLIAKNSGEYFHFRCKSNAKILIQKLKVFEKKGYQLEICYESTYLGFSLARKLLNHGLNCKVIASSLIPELPGSRVKNDRLDSKKLVKFYMQGLLTEVVY